MPQGWVLLPAHRTHEDFVEHRAIEPYGTRWGTSCNVVAEAMPPDGVPVGSPQLIRCKECFPTPPANLVNPRDAR